MADRRHRTAARHVVAAGAGRNRGIEQPENPPRQKSPPAGIPPRVAGKNRAPAKPWP